MICYLLMMSILQTFYINKTSIGIHTSTRSTVQSSSWKFAHSQYFQNAVEGVVFTLIYHSCWVYTFRKFHCSVLWECKKPIDNDIMLHLLLLQLHCDWKRCYKLPLSTRVGIFNNILIYLWLFCIRAHMYLDTMIFLLYWFTSHNRKC